MTTTPKRHFSFKNPAIHCAHDRLAEVATLVPHPRNPNKHGDDQIALLAKIIRHQGWRSPIVVSKRSGLIVAGHGRLEAAKLLKVKTVPVNDQEFETEADEWAHVVADNRLAELADMDGELLKELLIEIDDGSFDMDLTGFESTELERVVNYFRAEGIDAPELAEGDRAPFRQCTFTLHDQQFLEVEAAIRKAKEQGGGDSAVNDNSNGNALAWICKAFNLGK